MPVLYVYDLRPLWADHAKAEQAYDTSMFVVTLQGIVNRKRPQLLVYGREFDRRWSPYRNPLVRGFDGNIDRYWIDLFRQKGRWLVGTRLVPVKSLEALVTRFRAQCKGVTLWDPQVEATANVATTIAGVRDAPVVRYDPQPAYPSGDPTLYHLLVEKLGLRVVENLVGRFTGKGVIPGTRLPSTGSPKNDAYLWAKAHYLDSGRCNPTVMGYYEDAWARRPGKQTSSWIGLRDYLVAKRGFVFDVDVWADETPADDPQQKLGTDLRTFHAVMRSAYQQSGRNQPIMVLGFVPYLEKYSTMAGGQHEPVSSEWELARLLTPYNGHLSVDVYQGFTANLSVHSRAPKPRRLRQNAPPPLPPLVNKTYLCFYMGDYCDIGAIYNYWPILWREPSRGAIPLAWSFPPIQFELCPAFIEYLYETRTRNDYFTGGPSTYGYNFPNHLPTQGKPSPWQVSRDAAWRAYRRLDMSIANFVIENATPTTATKRLVAEIAPRGMGTNQDPGGSRFGSLPMIRVVDIATPTADVEAIAKNIHYTAEQSSHPGEQPNFLYLRAIWMEPDFMRDLVKRVKADRPQYHYQVLDPFSFFSLYKQAGTLKRAK